MADRSVLLCTEGTYPYVGGGVSTWCDILCRELAEIDFTIYAVTGTPEVRTRYELPPNVRGVVHVPLWGGEEPSHFILTDVPLSELRARRRATTNDVIEAEFIPLLRRLVGGMGKEAIDPETEGRLPHELWRYFTRYDWKRTWKSRLAWDAFLEEVRRPYIEESGRFHASEAPSGWDVTTAMRWLYNYLLPLAAPVPQADIAHTSIAGFAGLGGVLAKLEHGIPLVVTDHGVWVRERYIAVSAGPFSLFAKRFLMNLSTFVARLNYLHADVVSPVTAFNQRWEEPYGVEPERIRLIYNGVDPGVFRPRPKPEHRRGRPVVVAAARLFPLKDIETMIRAADVARREMPDVLFLVYGSLDADPEYTERCRALVAELELEGTFELAGHHPKPAELYTEGDISALSSISEAFPYTVLESMACGRPVVGTDVGGVREAVEGFGIVVPPRDHEAFGQACVRLLRDGQLRIELGRQARERVLAHYRITRSLAEYRALYGSLAA